MTVMPYSAARPLMRVGDMIGCRGARPLQRAIIAIKGGLWGLSHVATIVRDTTNQGTGRVEVIEAVNRGLAKNFLSQIYEASHGTLFWMAAHNTPQQQKIIMEYADALAERRTKYDFWSTITAPLQGLGFVMDIKKFNCSESFWYLQRVAGAVAPRYNAEGDEIAPVPGDCPVWCHNRSLVRLDMHK